MQPTLAASLAFAVASAVAFAMVARAVHRRPVSPEARMARDAFVLWWACLSFVEVVAALLLAPATPASVPLFLLATIFLLLVLCAGLCGLQFYLVYLYTDRKPLALLAVGYLLLFVLLLALILGTAPFHVEQTSWGPQLEGATDLQGSPLAMLVGVLFIGPTLWAAGAYLRLYGKVSDPLQKRRILLVGLSILLWFATSLGASFADIDAADWWQVASRCIALLAAGTIYYAYAGLKPKAPQPEPEPAAPPAGTARDLFDPRRRVAQV